MSAWVIWIIVAAALALGELATLGIFLGLIAMAAVLGALVAAAGGSLVIQLVVAIAASLLLLWLVRPIAKRHLHVPSRLRTGTAALVGKRAIVVERVDADTGRVKIDGETWSARAFDENQVIEPGARVEVVKIDGATAVVYL